MRFPRKTRRWSEGKIKGLGGQMFQVLPPKFRQDVTVSEWREGAAARARAHSTISTSFFLHPSTTSSYCSYRGATPFAFPPLHIRLCCNGGEREKIIALDSPLGDSLAIVSMGGAVYPRAFSPFDFCWYEEGDRDVRRFCGVASVLVLVCVA